jgi:hypothetical protein
MKIARLRWARHVIRMSDTEMSKLIMNYSPEGEKRARRPKAICIDAVDNDMRKAGVRNWRMEAKDRDGWCRILEESKAHI